MENKTIPENPIEQTPPVFEERELFTLTRFDNFFAVAAIVLSIVLSVFGVFGGFAIGFYALGHSALYFLAPLGGHVIGGNLAAVKLIHKRGLLAYLGKECVVLGFGDFGAASIARADGGQLAVFVIQSVIHHIAAPHIYT